MSADVKPEKPVPAEVRRVHRRVDNILQERHLTTKWLYERVGMTKEGWSNMVKAGSMKVGVLLKVAEALQLDVADLFTDEPVSALSEPAPGYHPKPRYLEQRVDELERELASLKEHLKRK